MTQQFIKKHQIAIQEYVDLVKSSKGFPPSKEVKELVKRNKVSSSISTDILRAGIVKRVNKGLYEVIIDTIEPIHARKVIESRRWYLNNVIRENLKNKNKKVSHKKFEKKFEEKYSNFKDTELLQEKPKTRTISILWGLFKINY